MTFKILNKKHFYDSVLSQDSNDVFGFGLVYIYKSKKCDISFGRNAIPQLLQSLGVEY